MRPDKDTYFLEMAALVSTRSTCLRRAVGAVAVNRLGHVLATGYNGVAAGLPHCNEHDPCSEIGFPHACDGAWAPSGTKLESCEALHAEMNMLLQCRDVQEIVTVYCTASPCVTCTKLLLNTGCKRVVFSEDYPGTQAEELWTRSRGLGSWVKKCVQS